MRRRAGKPIPEAAVVAAYGGRIEFLPLVPGVSTSELVRRIVRGSNQLFTAEIAESAEEQRRNLPNNLARQHHQ
jgi:hypothetical protein